MCQKRALLKTVINMAKKSAQFENRNKTQTKEVVTIFRHQYYPTEKEINEFALEMVQWIEEHEKCWKLSYFLRHKKISRATFYGWLKKYPSVQDAHEMAHYIIAERRERVGIEGKYPPMFTYMAMFDPDYKDYAAWRASLQKDKEPEAKQVVVIERFAPIREECKS